MEACQHNQKDIIEYLVQYPTSLGIKVDGVDDAGRNALFYLSESEDTGDDKVFSLVTNDHTK